MTPTFILLLIGMVAFIVLIAYWHASPSSDFDLRYMLVDITTGKASLYKVGQLIALLASTWVLIRETHNDRLNEWLFGAYMVAWAGVNLANKVIDKDRNAAARPE